MQDSTLYLIASGIVGLIIFYQVIKFATRSEARLINSAIQVKLLEMIALKSGVTKEEIDQAEAKIKSDRQP
jgi:hypothetical protein